MKYIYIKNLYHTKNGSKAYMIKRGICFDLTYNKGFASQYTDEEVENILKGKDYYLNIYGANEMATEEVDK